MGGINFNQLSPDLQAILTKADKNGDGNIDAQEKKALTSDEVSIWDNHIQVSGNNNGQVSTGNNSPNIATSGNKSPAAVTNGNNSDINQAIGDNAKIISLYQESNIDAETAKMLVDAGYTDASDIKYIKSTVSDPAFKQLTPENQAKVLKGITDSTNSIKELDIDVETAKIMTKAGVGHGKFALADMTTLKELVNSAEFTSLQPEERTILLQNIKYPATIESIVKEGDFNQFTLSENGNVIMKSSNHGYQLDLKTDDNIQLKQLRTEHDFSTIEKNGNSFNREVFRINSASGNLTYTNEPKLEKTPIRDVYLSNCGGEGNDKLIVDNQSGRKLTYHILDQTNKYTKNRMPADNHIEIRTNNTSEKSPDQAIFTRRYEKTESAFSDGRPTLDTVTFTYEDKQTYNLKAGSRFTARTDAGYENKSKKNLSHKHTNYYIRSSISCGRQPDKIESKRA